MYNIESGRKTISVKQLTQLLNYLPDDYLLEVNRVGNLLIVENDKYIGYIDFNDEITQLCK